MEPPGFRLSPESQIGSGANLDRRFFHIFLGHNTSGVISFVLRVTRCGFYNCEFRIGLVFSP